MRLRQIAKIVADEFGVAVDQICSTEHRASWLSLPRHVTWYLCRRYTDKSVYHIGQQLGGFDYSSVSYGFSRIGILIEKDADLSSRVARLQELITGPTKAVERDEAIGNLQEELLSVKAELLAARNETKQLRAKLAARDAPLEPAVRRYLEAHLRLETDLYTRSEAAARREVDAAFDRLKTTFYARHAAPAAPQRSSSITSGESAHAQH